MTNIPVTRITRIALPAMGLFILGCVTDWTRTSVRSCENLQPGDWVRITDRMDVVRTGAFLELQAMPFLDYLTRSREMIAGDSACARLSFPGEHIAFNTVVDPLRLWKGVLIGFCHQYLSVRLDGEAEISHFYITGIARIVGWDGRMIQRYEFRKLLTENKVPLRTVMAVRCDLDTLHFPLNDVKSIEVLEHGAPHALDIFALAGGTSGMR